MSLKYWLPPALENYVQLIRNRRKFRKAVIDTPFIQSPVEIGEACALCTGVILMANCALGSYSYLNYGTKVGLAKIGKFCSVGNDCEIGMHRHPVGYISTSPLTYAKGNIFKIPSLFEELSTYTEIGNDVWIGSKAVIMQGVKIGDGAVIGAGSIVTRNVAPYEIVCGVPARHLRFRFDEETIDFLEKLRWWDMDPDEIKTIVRYVKAGDAWTSMIAH